MEEKLYLFIQFSLGGAQTGPDENGKIDKIKIPAAAEQQPEKK